MANSVHQDYQGPIWCLGNIVVPTPGTYVSIMSLVDNANTNAPETPTNTLSKEYAPRFNQATFQGFKVGANPPKLANNTGNVYLVHKPLAGAGGTTDVGTVIAVIAPGQTFTLVAAALNRNSFNPYEFQIDADTANDACQVTLFIQ